MVRGKNYKKEATETKKLTTDELVAKALVEKIKKYRMLPWTSPFMFQEPMNYMTGQPYKGINKWLLDGGSEYITMSQLKEYNKGLGKDEFYWVKKGTKGHIVVYYNFHDKDLSESKVAQIRERNNGNLPKYVKQREDGSYYMTDSLLRHSFVFNIEDTTNKKGESLPSKIVSDRNHREYIDNKDVLDNLIETYMQKHEMTLTRSSGSAYFRPSTDTVNMPPKQQFGTDDEYYRVFFHELIHSTHGAGRLHRKSAVNYSHEIQERSDEELVAEAGSSMLSVYFGFPQDTFAAMNSTIYISGWIKWIENNPTKIVSALKNSETAVEYLLSHAGMSLKEEDKGKLELIDGFEAVAEARKKKDEIPVEKRMAKKEEPKKSRQKPIKEFLELLVANNEKVNKQRGTKLYARVKKNNLEPRIEQELGLKTFGVFSAVPVYALELDKTKVMLISYTFIILVDKEKEQYKVLFRIESGNTVKEIEEFAVKSKIEPLKHFTKLMRLR